MTKQKRLAIVLSHPTQYYSPWFKYLSSTTALSIKVFYLWDFGIRAQADPEFKKVINWDTNLLDGYESEFLPNRSRSPGTHSWFGLNHPDLSARIKSYRPDAVLLFGYNFLTHIRFIFTWKTSAAPLLFRGDSHSLYDPRSTKGTFRQAALRLLFQRFSAFLAVGKANREYFLQHGVPADRIFNSPHAVDNDFFISQAAKAKEQAFELRRSLNISPADKIVLFCGKFQEKKQPLELLRAFQKVASSKDHLFFAGSGELEQALRDSASHAKNIHFLGFQNQTEISRVYSAADLFILPSFGRYETWGLAVNEAMCFALPVIVSSHVGCHPDLVHPGRNGWIFPAGDPQALAVCLGEALSDQARLKNYGEESRRIIDGYSYAAAAKGLLEALSYACK